MQLRLFLPIILSLGVFADGGTIRGAKRTGKRRFKGAFRKCYSIFIEYEDCLVNIGDCEDLRDEYFECMYENGEADGYLDCNLSSIGTTEDIVEERSAFSPSSNVTSSSFGTAMFAELCSAHKGNVLFSPLSVYRALELVEDGATASSDNREELDRLLGPLQLREQVKALQEFDTTSGNVQLNMATSVWADDLKDSFMNHAMTEHSAEAFDLPKTYAPVDDWIEEKTNGMITELMGDDPLDPLTRALLVDTVYFKGTWTYSFDPSLNSDGKFYYRDGSDTEVTYMKDSRTIEAVQASPILGDASFVKLDYGQDTEFTAMFILPKSSSDESMNDVITGLNSQPLSELLEEAQTIPVELKLPRFHLDFGPTQLKPVLKNMGMNIAFDINLEGKFNRMSYDRGLYVEDVHHGACIEINEEGTEASAATVVVVSKRSTPRITPFQIEFDRPFVVVILHQESGVPLFIGKVEKPDFT